MSEPISITIPWVPDQACNPNNHRVSERTRIRHRKRGAIEAIHPIKAAYNELNRGRGMLDEITPFAGPCVLDITVRWGYRQKSWDRDNLITAFKFVQDQLQRLGLVLDDKHIAYGAIVQERATQQPETVLTIRADALAGDAE